MKPDKLTRAQIEDWRRSLLDEYHRLPGAHYELELFLVRLGFLSVRMTQHSPRTPCTCHTWRDKELCLRRAKDEP